MLHCTRGGCSSSKTNFLSFPFFLKPDVYLSCAICEDDVSFVFLSCLFLVILFLLETHKSNWEHPGCFFKGLEEASDDLLPCCCFKQLGIRRNLRMLHLFSLLIDLKEDGEGRFS